MVEGFRLMVSGTVQAALLACGLRRSADLQVRLAIHIGGGLRRRSQSRRGFIR
jgi:hypothetical protein